ncbi:polycomb protein SUZ12-like isoform X2 [Haliotis rubra]|uniref:polycomb protein SUZ12-like isoform X1 n=1 Tax=Haliotis rubra TaxID=36100 RepID=UPI001EE5993B|nr:polycomb protein SUZ12-like isoform X1 [Haliotis rubra]XP_046581922.1 polycomb protein SUZ12-like isoform X2 [Haliotis rubra]
MRPKKREREKKAPQEPIYETPQADHELFLQAFEKPTQIYRFLRTRNVVLPIFLHRSLWYMKQRRSVNNANRKAFKIDSLLSQVEAKRRREAQITNYKSEFMNLTFKGFADPGIPSDNDTADVEILLLKICHKKRKDVSSPVMQTVLGKVKVSLNPDVDISPANTLTIGHDNFHHNNGHAVRSYVLVIKVVCPVRRHLPNGVCNGDLYDSDEPPHKRRKNGKTFSHDEDSLHYGAELVIYDKHRRCLLTDGDYEVALQDLGSQPLPKGQAAWETVMDGKAVGPFEVFNKCPTLKFSLRWTETAQGAGDHASVKAAQEEFINNNQLANHILDNDNSGKHKDTPVHRLKDSNQTTPRKRSRIFYQFLYNNNTRQQTEAREDLRCPWCSINCMQLYSLLKHLRLDHARFDFLYVPHSKDARIDVSINERYDGSYVGNPQDLHSHIGYAFSRNGPVRRTPVTHVIVYRPKSPEASLTEFMEPENDIQINRQFVQGHNRLYYHLVTCAPIRPQEIDFDNEAENDPLWLRQKTINMIDEFTDVNEGEKELMKLWNLHIIKHEYIADCQLGPACKTFIEENGKTVIEKNLCRNFMLHMVNLFDFSLIKPDLVHNIMGQLEIMKQKIKVESTS